MLYSFDGFKPAGEGFCAVKLGGKMLINNIVYKGRFSRARNAGNAYKTTQRYFDGYIFKIIFGGTLNGKEIAASISPLFGNTYLFSTRKVVGGN